MGAVILRGREQWKTFYYARILAWRSRFRDAISSGQNLLKIDMGCRRGADSAC
jgi:hypothetical protein